VAQELFATALDAYLLLDQIPERANYTQTADGKPATKAAARTRLGRMIAADSEEFNHRDALAIAAVATVGADARRSSTWRREWDSQRLTFFRDTANFWQ
jgi:uncharacterized hydantoinase/oxoprolinase family protein